MKNIYKVLAFMAVGISYIALGMEPEKSKKILSDTIPVLWNQDNDIKVYLKDWENNANEQGLLIDLIVPEQKFIGAIKGKNELKKGGNTQVTTGHSCMLKIYDLIQKYPLLFLNIETDALNKTVVAQLMVQEKEKGEKESLDVAKLTLPDLKNKKMNLPAAYISAEIGNNCRDSFVKIFIDELADSKQKSLNNKPTRPWHRGRNLYFHIPSVCSLQ